MKNNVDENQFKTSDLALATTISLSFPVIARDRATSPRVFFVFHRTPELDVLVERFWRGEITVEPQAFANQIKNLKTRIYSGE
ncbi:MAG: DUF5659 domain-containing protein [Candidatus Gottesmanbacteria bacterium]|nr:DUF5659 domain-containing protein [Candidatus Gottesmanbacteria bacterium]